MRLISIVFIIISLLPIQCNASRAKLPIPRFVSIKSNEANIRTGPNVRYPIKWVFISKNEPVEILAEFEQWRKIKDIHGDSGWVHESMLTGKRFVIVNSTEKQIILYKDYKKLTHPVAIIENGARANLVECNKEWCKISAQNYKGWIAKNHIWGVYQNEIYK